LKQLKGSPLTFDETTASNTAATYYYKVAVANSVGWSAADNEVAARYAGSSATGYTVLTDPSGEPAALAARDLDIEWLKVSQPSSGANAGKLVFSLKMANLSMIPDQRMWRIVWNDPHSPHQQFYVGMTSDNGITFEYGAVITTTTGLVLGTPNTNKLGVPDSGSYDAATGVITIALSKDKIGNPAAGDVLGAFSVRTYNAVKTLIRSTEAIDSTTNATANDYTANAAAYVVVAPTSGGKKGGGK